MTVPNPENLVRRSARELAVTYTRTATSVTTGKPPAHNLHKCLEAAQTELKTAIEEERMKDCQLQLNYIRRIQGELRQR